MTNSREPDRRLVLFDVDATLLRTEGAGMRAMTRAGADIFGPSLRWDGIEPSGGLDPLLVSDAARRSGVPFSQERHDAFRDRYVALLAGELARSAKQVRILPGVRQLLAALREMPEVTIGLLTGNYAATAALKIEAVGLAPSWFSITAFGDEAESRPGLVALAMERYAELHGRRLDPPAVVMVGDTPRDVEAALRNGCRCLGVATGKYSMDELLAAGAHLAVPTLEDPKVLPAILDGHGDRVRTV